MNTVAFFAIVLAAFLALIGSAVSLWAVWKLEKGHHPYVGTVVFYAEKIHDAQFWLLSFASAVLLCRLVQNDFSLAYVADYTDRSLSFFYKITAFWAGQSGSLLFWALCTVVIGLFFAKGEFYQRLSHATRLWYLTFFLGIMAFFCVLLCAWSNPFEPVIGAIPADGRGLNPLLRNPGMIFHPPLLFLGYAGLTVSGCLAPAQALASRGSLQEPNWILGCRSFLLSSWSFLTAGIVLGAWWAYMELGWGGYWAWDPVENASLVPWLFATALLHLRLAQTRSGLFVRSNVGLAGITLLSTFFATFIVRSGIIQSVHAFSDNAIGFPLLLFLAAGIVVIVSASFVMPTGKTHLPNPLTKEGMMFFFACGCLFLAVLISIATFWPVLTAQGGGNQQGLTAAFYNRACLPFFALLIWMLSLCFGFKWRSGLYWNVIGWILVSEAVQAGVLYFVGYHNLVALFGIVGSIGVVIAVIWHIAGSIRTPDKIGAACVHLGLGIVALGIAVSGPYSTDFESTLGRGEGVGFGQYEIRLDRLHEGQTPEYIWIEAGLKVLKDGKTEGFLTPQRRIYHSWEGMAFAEASTLFSLGTELYASLIGVEDSGRVTVRISTHPLVNWLWIGGSMMCFGAFFWLFGRRTGKAETGSEC